MSFVKLGLVPELLRAIERAGYETPTPIQLRAIPIALEGRDILGCAQTGTGKTAGFSLPILQRLKGQARGGTPRALILTPTRELAAQVTDSVRTYGKFLPLRSAVVFGGVGMDAQIREMRRGVDILVATPGRLLDLMGRGYVDLSRVEVLVLDEADRMLDMGFIPDVRRIVRAVPTERQTMLFSATMPAEIERLAGEVLRHPAVVEVGRRSAPTEGVRQLAYPVDRARKRELLLYLLRKHQVGQALVFTRTKHGADRLAEKVERAGWKVAVLHSNKSQQARTRAMNAFRNGEVQILVATDIAARGIDVEGISHVFNFDMPNVAEDYVHRIGRTARAAATGDAISLVEPGEQEVVREIEKLIDMEMPYEVILDFAPGRGASAATSVAPAPRGERGTAQPKATGAAPAGFAGARRRRRGRRGARPQTTAV